MSNKDIERKIKNARIKFFRNDAGLQFFGTLAYAFNWLVHKIDKNAEGYVVFDPKDPNRSADGTIHINEDCIKKPDYDHDNLIALIMHEEFHILNKHGIRRGQRKPDIWNVACDHVVDRDLKEVTNVKPYKGQYNIIQDLHQKDPKCTAEQAYDWIEANQQKIQIHM